MWFLYKSDLRITIAGIHIGISFFKHLTQQNDNIFQIINFYL